MSTEPSNAPHKLVVPSAVRRGGRMRAGVWIAGLVGLALVGLGVRAYLDDAPEAARFRTSPVERRSVQSVIEATGSLDVLTRVEVPAPVGAPLVEIAVSAGADVKAGEILARLDVRSAQSVLSSARATLDAARAREAEAQAQLRGAEDARRRVEALVAKGFASDGELATSRAAQESARAALAAARADRAKAAEGVSAGDAELSQRTIRAPIDGIVLVAPRWQGAVVAPDKGPLFVLGSPIDVLRLEVAVGEADIAAIRLKQKARFTVPAFPLRELEAEVEQVRIEPSKRDGTVTFPVLLQAANPERQLLPGMSATARIRVAEAVNVLVVRDAALRFTVDGAPEAPPRSRVWVSRDGVALEAVSVAVGVSDGIYTEVIPSPANALDVGTPVVVGLAPAEGSGGPGISLGSKK